MSDVMLEVKELTTKYITRFHEDVYAVDHVSLKVEEGKSLGIAGESGCGKSTLALSLMGYYFPPLHYTSGEIIIDGKNITVMKPDDIRKSVLGTEIASLASAVPAPRMDSIASDRGLMNVQSDVFSAGAWKSSDLNPMEVSGGVSLTGRTEIGPIVAST